MNTSTQREFNRISLLVNPVAGSGQGRNMIAPVSERLIEIFPDAEVTLIETQGASHASWAAATLDTDLLLVVSGDGTVHDVAQGIMKRPRTERPVLAHIPIGSGNDFARTLGLPADPRAALETFATAVCLPIDVGRCSVKDDTTQIYFLETLSFGVDAAVAINTVELRKTTRMRGTGLYARAALSAIIHELRPFHATYMADELRVESELLICAVQNGPTYGSGFLVAPSARITDGKLNVCVARRMNKLQALYCLTRIKAGTHEGLAHFSTYVVRRFEIRLNHQLPIQCDGERMQGTHILIEAMPDALDVLVPRDASVLTGLAGDHLHA